ncbi:sulfatase [bacterium]|nr:sulfatase [bacterium]
MMNRSTRKRRQFLREASVALAALALPRFSPAAQAQRPNLLFVLADQFRRQALGFLSEDPIRTPNFDRFAAQGQHFPHAISARPVCTPFRAMLMTGRFPLSTGMVSNCQSGLDLELDANEICFSDVLKQNDYQTNYIGKWHLEMPSASRMQNPPDGAKGWDAWTPPGPRRHGFDFWYAYNTFDDHFHPHYWTDAPEKIEVNHWSVEHETDVAIDRIRQRAPKKPFALFLSWNPPHPPYVAPEKYLKQYREGDLPWRENSRQNDDIDQKRRAYYAAVSSCDANFGRLLEALEEQGLSDDTIVVFTSDHGEMLGSHGQFGKSVYFEESVGIPFLIRWPGRIEPGQNDLLFGCYDFMPTLLGLMSLPIPASVEGTDRSGRILGAEGEEPQTVFLMSISTPPLLKAVGQQPTRYVLNAVEKAKAGVDWRQTGYRGVRSRRYTYIVKRTDDGTADRLLYDNETDPYQMRPLKLEQSGDDPIATSLEKDLAKWLKKSNDTFSLEMQ